MSTIDVDGGILLDDPNRPIRPKFGDRVVTPEGYHGKIVEFDGPQDVKVAFTGDTFGMSAVVQWYELKELVLDEV